MAMQRQKYSISGLAVELGVDRRTLSKKLDGLKPVEIKGKSRLYHLADVIQHLRLLDSPKAHFNEWEVEDRKIAENEVAFFDSWAEPLRDYLWEAGKPTKENAKRVLKMVQDIWVIQLKALEGWVGLENTSGLDTPEFVELLQDPDKFKEEVSYLFDDWSDNNTELSDLDLDSVEVDLSKI